MKKIMLLLCFLILHVTSVCAVNSGDWIVRARLITINPDYDSSIVTVNDTDALNGSTLSVDDNVTLDIDITYMLKQHWGLELLLDITSEHDIRGQGLLEEAAPGVLLTSRVLPPTLFLQYHLMPSAKMRPYVGMGINYTLFFDEEASDSFNTALNSLGLGNVTDIDMKESAGIAAQMGIDFEISKNWFGNLDIKWISMDTSAKISTESGAVIRSDVDINPWIFGFGFGRIF